MLPVQESDSPAVTYTTSMLHELSCPIHCLGYDYIILAVTRYTKGDMQSLSKELYPYIAERYGYADWHPVERSIRTAISYGWANGDPLVWDRYFPNAEKAPANKLFIVTLAERLQQNTPPEIERG